MKNKQIVVAGVSANKSKYGYKIFTDLVKNGYKVIGVNPKVPIIDGHQTFSSLTDIQEKIDLLIIVTPPTISVELIKQASDQGIKEVWLQPGAESKEAVDLARKLGINLTYNACFMVKQQIW